MLGLMLFPGHRPRSSRGRDPRGLAKASGSDPRGEVTAALPSIAVGTWANLTFAFTPFFIVDDDASLVTAMRKSARATKHYSGIDLPLRRGARPDASSRADPDHRTRPDELFLARKRVRLRAVHGAKRSPVAHPRTSSGAAPIRRLLQFTLVTLGLVFAGLWFWVTELPTLRGSAWSIKDTAIRASAIVMGVGALIVLLALLLPYMLDRLEGRRFTSFVAARHVRSQKSGFLTIISVLSILGVAMSSCSLSSVVSVMGGFSQDLKRKILGNNAHIVIDTTAGTPFVDYDEALTKVRAIKGVTGATPVVHGEVMASSASNLAGVIVTGIDPETIESVIELAHNIEVGKIDYLEHPEKLTRLPPSEVIGMGPGGEPYFKGAELPGLPDDIDPAVKAVIIAKSERPGIILGRELAKTLHVYVGDEVTLVSPLGDLGPMGVMPRTKKFRVAAEFYSGMYEYDATHVYILLDVAQDYFQTAQKRQARSR